MASSYIKLRYDWTQLLVKLQKDSHMPWTTSPLPFLLSFLALIFGFWMGGVTGILIVLALVIMASVLALVIKSHNKATAGKPPYARTSSDSPQSDAGAALILPLVAIGDDSITGNKPTESHDNSGSNDNSGGFWSGVSDFFSGSGDSGGGGYSGGDSGGGGDGGGGGGGGD